jgi:hypothetical protein
LAWVELYRQEVTFLDSGHDHINSFIDIRVKHIRSALADGHLNTQSDWEDWEDCLLFREELRAIGESLIYTTENKSRSVMGYAAFQGKFFGEKSDKEEWINGAVNFFVDLGQKKKDFRVYRLRFMLKNSLELLELFDEEMITPKLKQKKIDIEEKIDALNRIA